MRAADPNELDQLEAECRDIVMAPQAVGVEVVIHEIGRRPAGSIDEQHPLVRIARATSDRYGVANEIIASSTDANAAHPRGISAVALGITYGAGEHTSDEWIDVEFVATGLRILADTVIDYAHEMENDD
jgi:acetylornithine deacetylase/succinyl-diaminopimelate desuccinylase-like protein